MPKANAPSLIWALTLAVSVAVGAAIGTGHEVEIAAVAAALAIVAGFAKLTQWALTREASTGFSMVLVAAALMPSSGLRVGSATFSDGFLLVGAALVLAPYFAGWRELPPLPEWLKFGVPILALSACASQILAPDIKAGLLLEFSGRRLDQAQSATTGSNLVFATRFLFAIAIVPVIVAVACDSYARVRLLATFWLAGAAASCVVAILAAFSPFDVQAVLTGEAYTFKRSAGVEALRYTGLTVHPNHLALTAVLAAPVALVRLPTKVWLYGPLLGIYTVGVLISGSRTAALALVLAMVATAAVQPTTRKPLALVGLAGATLGYQYIAGAGLATLQRLTGAGSTNSVSQSGDERSEVLRQGIDLFFGQPLTGYGFQTVRGAHNIYLQMLTAGGLVALVGYLAILGGALLLARELARTKELPADVRALAVGAGASLGVWLVAGLVSNNTIDRWVYLPVALLLGVSVAHWHERRAPRT